jgi:branched-chain amino acid aminotransferase
MLIVYQQIPYTELPTFSEVMAAGAAAALVPIKSITMTSKNEKFEYQNGTGKPGPICVRFLTTFKGIQSGKIEDTFGWLETVQEAKDFKVRARTNALNGHGVSMSLKS